VRGGALPMARLVARGRTALGGAASDRPWVLPRRTALVRRVDGLGWPHGSGCAGSVRTSEGVAWA